MPVMDEFREEREALKNSSFKYKFKYFIDYYKWHVIGVIIALIVIGSIVKDIVTAKDYIFFGFFLNAYGDETAIQEYMDEFAEAAGLDTEKYDVGIDNSLSLDLNAFDEYTMTAVNRVVVSITAGDIDFLAADPPAFEHYASIGTFFDLTTILSTSQLEAYEPYFYYIDLAEVRRKEAATSPDDYVAKEFDHRDPSTMEEPVLVGLYIEEAQELSSIFHYKEADTIIGIPATAKHLETSIKFIDYIFE